MSAASSDSPRATTCPGSADEDLQSSADPSSAAPDPALIKELATTIGIADRPDAVWRLQLQLIGGGEGVELWRRCETHEVPPSTLIAALEGLRRPLRAVLDAFGIDPAKGWDPAGLRATLAVWRLNLRLVEAVQGENFDRLAKEEREGERLAAHLQGVVELHQAASLAIEQVGRDKRTGHGGARRRPGLARNMTAFELIQLYERVTGRKAKRSWDPDNDEATGPLVRFLTLTMRHYGFPVTSQAARALIVSYRKGKLSALR